MPRIDELKTQIAQLDELIRTGVLTGEPAREARQRLEAELLQAVLLPQASLPAANTDVTQPRPSRRLWLGIAAFVGMFSLLGYTWLGNLPGWMHDPASDAASAAAAAAAAPAAAAASLAPNVPPPAIGEAQIEAMVGRLAERLKAKPDDAQGWAMLGRSNGVLGRHAEAAAAYRKVVELKPQEAQGFADLADALGTVDGRSLDGEPEQVIAKALALDPDNPKALFLAGTLAFNRGQHAGAARQWERSLRAIDPGSEMAAQLQGALDEARKRAGLSPLTIAKPVMMAAPPPSETRKAP